MLFYMLGHLIGYFFVMILCMVIAIIIAKTKAAWIVYAVGAGIQLMSLLGIQRTAKLFGLDMGLYWVIYLVLLIISAVLIIKVKKLYEKREIRKIQKAIEEKKEK